MTDITDALDAAATACVDAMDDAGMWLRSEDEWGWPNTIGTSPAHGRGHVERYTGPKTEILHVTVLPSPGSARPIFGTDIVALGGVVTLMCWDWTPTVPEGPLPRTLPPRCGEARPVPEWADPIFSRHAMIARPVQPGDVEVFLDFAAASLRSYLESPLVTGSDNLPAVRRYVAAQRENDRLWRLLTAHVGEDKARRFIHEVLWPMPEIWQ